MNSRCLSAITVAIVTLCHVSDVSAAVGDILKTYDWVASSFIAHPTRPIVYAAITSENAIGVIDTNTLEVQKVPIGTSPRAMALSNDASTLYVANSDSSFLGRINTGAGTALTPLPIQGRAYDVEVGSNDRLFVIQGYSGSAHLDQLSPLTGQSIGPELGYNGWIYSGAIEITPDKNTLYYGNFGVSPATMNVIDVSNPNAPNFVGGITPGSNGQEVVVSPKGTFVAYPNGYPYSIDLYGTSESLPVLGTLETGPYPMRLAFSPDEEFAYTVNGPGAIKVWSTDTFSQVDSFEPAGEPVKLGINSHGSRLFASNNDYRLVGTQVFDTGRYIAIPEPAAIQLVIGLAAFGLRLRARSSALRGC